MRGDCLERMKEIPSQSVDMVLTDPPYGTTRCKWDSVIDLKLMWVQLKRIIKIKGCIALFGSEPFSSVLRLSNINNFRYDWIWEKEQGVNFLSAKKQPLKVHENILIFSKKQTVYNPQMTKGDPYKRGNHGTSGDVTNNVKKQPNNNKGNRYPRSIQKFNRQRGLHPTQKPVALMEYLIKTYTIENETVLDFTMGSGTTGVACMNLKRKFIGIEKDKKYYKIAKERVRNEKQTL